MLLSPAEVYLEGFVDMYNIAVKKAENIRMPAFSEDRFAALKKEYTRAAAEPSNLRYGYVRAD